MTSLLRGEQAADDAAGHGQQRVPQPGAPVRGVQQQLRLTLARVEQRVAGDHVVADQEAVEVALHVGSQDLQRLRGLLPSRPAQDLGMAADLLVQQRHGPAAYHPVAHRRINGL